MSDDLDTRDIRAALSRALSAGEASLRLAHADTSVLFHTDGGPERGVTLLLDRVPCAVAEHPEPAEIEIHLPQAAVRAFAHGELSMTAAILSGEARASGPVRKYLEVDPILRSLLATVGVGVDGRGWDRGAGHALSANGSRGAAIDPDLLAIETRGLHKSFGTQPVLAGLDLQIPEGVISVVLGPSGTGKSVLLQHVIGVMRPDAGDVLIRGRSLARMSRSDVLALRREVGVMFQDGALFSAMNVFENVAFPLRQHTDLDEREVRAVVEEHLASVGLGGASDRMPNELSGGMRKRAGLARALVLSPSIILCDEPDSGLDPVRTSLLGDVLVAQHAEQGGTMVVVTHNVALARRIADHISVLWQGVVLETGLAADVLASETPFVRQFLAGAGRGPLGMDA